MSPQKTSNERIRKENETAFFYCIKNGKRTYSELLNCVRDIAKNKNIPGNIICHANPTKFSEQTFNKTRKRLLAENYIYEIKDPKTAKNSYNISVEGMTYLQEIHWRILDTLYTLQKQLAISQKYSSNLPMEIKIEQIYVEKKFKDVIEVISLMDKLPIIIYESIDQVLLNSILINLPKNNKNSLDESRDIEAKMVIAFEITKQNIIERYKIYKYLLANSKEEDIFNARSLSLSGLKTADEKRIWLKHLISVLSYVDLQVADISKDQDIDKNMLEKLKENAKKIYKNLSKNIHSHWKDLTDDLDHDILNKIENDIKHNIDLSEEAYLKQNFLEIVADKYKNIEIEVSIYKYLDALLLKNFKKSGYNLKHTKIIMDINEKIRNMKL